MSRDATLPEDSDHVVQGLDISEVPPGCVDLHPGPSEYCTLLRKNVVMTHVLLRQERQNSVRLYGSYLSTQSSYLLWLK